ncbi:MULTISPECIES: alpha/beta fold hydrolase [Actinomadura]|uniref:alpha/beta fold hydrolase n=1 Tax=Actinomadura TaxID=1988 RepID=UPI00040603B7|nr:MULTISPECIES: alpha/beta fold hydrolase [Actinomadura]RSN68903.1 alpha/beta hydrolase [Actinomadura sp. WAC 06369]
MNRFPEYPFASHRLDLGGVRLHYVDEGSGPPVLFVHGNPSWSYLWRWPILTLRDRFRCVAPDHVGMGLSDKPGEDRYAYTLASRVDDLDALVEYLIAERGAPERGWTLAMHDWGGPIGAAWAARRPERVERLVVLNTAAFPNPHGERVRVPLRVPFRVLRDTRLGERMFLRHNLFARLATLPPLGVRRPMPKAVRAAFLAPTADPANRRAIQRFVQDVPLRPGDPAWPLLHGAGEALAAFAHLPVLIGWGLRDVVLDRAMLDEWRRRFPAARTHAYEDAGHYVLEDTGYRFLVELRDFMCR